MAYLNLLTVGAEIPLGDSTSMTEDGFKQAALRVEPTFSPQVTEYTVAVPSQTKRLRLNGMSYAAGAVKVDGMTGNMRVVDFDSDAKEIHMTLHDHEDGLVRTYTFSVNRTTADLDESLVTTVTIGPPPPPPPAMAHGHSHGGVACDKDHGHGHADGAASTETHPEKGHGHSHGGVACDKDHGHGHGHADGAASAEVHSEKGHGHSHGGVACEKDHGHGHANAEEAKEQPEKGHGHSHGDGAKCTHDHGHGH
eukprot:CAMPEP_0198203628 /NCGR_PEP_ID=MMETSP1445-20131203/6932_1 /TAXON_ID=36898 /ORGANISM="Pyramimonas sp., Strain CCMP2087" /LENGTH=251 /DNA_ID=CAMNT_0043875093 /DNA_START=113 /DNA_END=868 /DNA_ORIENTATION=-